MKQLDYATKNADGLPDFEQASENLIDQGAGPYSLRDHFLKANDAVRYFAKSMQRRYAFVIGELPCVTCKKPTREWCVVLWQAYAPPKFFEFTLLSENNKIQFNTFHPMCKICAQKMQQQYRPSILLHRFALLVLVVGLIIAALSRLTIYEDMASLIMIAAFGSFFLLITIFGLLFKNILPNDIKKITRKGLKTLGPPHHANEEAITS